MKQELRALSMAYLIWGFGPLYWKVLADFDPDYVLAHRMLWSAVLLFVWALASQRVSRLLCILKNPRDFFLTVVSAALIGANWFLYIYAVQIGKTWEASLGYFILPLMSMSIGAILFREQLARVQWIAVALVAFAVGFLTLSYGELPLIALFLATSFLLYSLLYKVTKRSAVDSLLLETILLSPLALYYLFAVRPVDVAVISTTDMFLLVGTGPLSVMPLFFFNFAVSKVPLSLIGIGQYVAPSLQLLLAVFAFGEEIHSAAYVSFAIIWIAITLFFVPHIVKYRASRLAS